MAGLARAWRSLGRLFAGPPLESDDVAAASQTQRGGMRAMTDWLGGCLAAARRRNEQAAIEETRSYLRAKRRSLSLMLSLLNAEQQAEFHRYRYFHVVGGETGTRYRIRIASFANIDIIGPGGSTMYRLCAHPRGDIPVYDVMAAQMLHLQDAATERTFLRSANVHPVLDSERQGERGVRLW